MSRIGKAPVSIPEQVQLTVNGSTVAVKGPKGELSVSLDKDMKVELKDGTAIVSRPTDQKRHKSLHGLSRALLFNAVEGVHKGYEKKLELVGVGYKATVSNNLLDLSLGYSHSIAFALPAEINATAETQKGKNPIITLASHDKQLLGQVTAKVRSLRKTEPYKGKGIKFVGEVLRRKAGKTAAK